MSCVQLRGLQHAASYGAPRLDAPVTCRMRTLTRCENIAQLVLKMPEHWYNEAVALAAMVVYIVTAFVGSMLNDRIGRRCVPCSWPARGHRRCQ
jgi:hypothetical protein